MRVACRRLSGGAVIIFEESAEAFFAFDFAVGTADSCLWKGDMVVQALMIALRLIICDVFSYNMAQRFFADKNHLVETFGFYFSYKVFSVGI